MISSAGLIIDVDRVTGEFIWGWPRAEQSIKTILTTRLKTRLERLWWGSDFMDTMDKPMVQEVFALSMLSAFRYIDLYEPEYKVRSASMSPSYDGSCIAVVDGIYLPDQSNQSVVVNIYRSGPSSIGSGI